MLSSGDKTGVEQESSSGYSLDEMIAHKEVVRYCCDNLSTGERNVRSQARELIVPPGVTHDLSILYSLVCWEKQFQVLLPSLRGLPGSPLKK